MTFTHNDRDEIKRRAEEDFPALVEEYGGRRRGRAYCCPFHEDRTPSASIHKDRFHCFACNESWDVFAFIQKVRGEDFKGALEFLAARYSVPLNDKPLTDAERREYARRREAAELEAGGLVAWRDGLIAALQDARNNALAAYHRSIQYVLTHGLDGLLAEFAMDGADVCEERYQRLDETIGTIKRAPFDRLLLFYRRTIRAEAETSWVM